MSSIIENKILQGNCIEIISQLPDSSVDLIFADPPYNLQLSHELLRPNRSKVDAVNDDWDQFDNFEQYDNFTQAWLSGCKRVLKDTGTLWVIGSYHNIFRIGKILQDLEYWILNDVVWIKDNPMPNFRGVRFTNAHETLIWAQKKKGAKYTFNHQSMKAMNEDLQMRSDWYLPLCTGSERQKTNGQRAHATQKPEGLLYRILLASTKPGDLVLDPFFGSGTTGAVAKKLGRYYIGIESNPDYIKVASDRIANVKPAPDSSLNIVEPRNRKRVPFGALLEAGYLHPGQTLIFSENKSISAVILANSHIECNGLTGSIHFIAKTLLRNAPVNGWDLWLYNSGDHLETINSLRTKYISILDNNK